MGTNDLNDLKNRLEADLGVDTAKAEGVCFNCRQPFTDKNVFTDLGWKETKISQTCEACFDSMFAEPEEGDDSTGGEEPGRTNESCLSSSHPPN